jgi:hypothetical protein
MVKCEVAKRTLKLSSWVPSLLQVCSSLKGPNGLTAEFGFNTAFAKVNPDARSELGVETKDSKPHSDRDERNYYGVNLPQH